MRPKQPPGVDGRPNCTEWFSVQNDQIDTPESEAGELLSKQQFFSLEQVVSERLQLLALSQQ
jgi:hypothetical protein